MTADFGRSLRDRTFRFGCDTARLALTLMARPGVKSIAEQLIKAGTAVGANLEEAKAASTKREFARGVDLALREARESLYWLRLGAALELADRDDLDRLAAEADQLVRILTTIALNARRPSPNSEV